VLRTASRWVAAAAIVALIVVGVARVPAASRAAYNAQASSNGNSVGSSTPINLYLKTDGPGDRTSTAVLPMSTLAPTVAVLPNYDTDRDAFAGLVIQKGGLGAGESDPLKHQTWSMTVASTMIIDVRVQLFLWSSVKDFDTGKGSEVDAYLLDCTVAGAGCVTIDSTSVIDASWNDGVANFGFDTYDFGVVNYTVAAGRSLRVKVTVDPPSADDMWFAYDTTSYPSRLLISGWT
jgi:hypothetical protein